MTLPPLVVTDHAARTYGSGRAAVVALHDTSCVVDAGEAIAIVGPSGSGKTTLLHLLAGLDGPTVGQVTWPALGGHPRSLRPGTVAVVFQGPSLLPALDALENVALPLLLAGEDERVARRAAAAALDALGLTEVTRLLPEELSGGQAQRVATARALAAAPQLLIADEPTGQLDHASANAVMDTMLRAVQATGAAVVVATHDAAVAARFDARWEMDDGTLRTEAGACLR